MAEAVLDSKIRLPIQLQQRSERFFLSFLAILRCGHEPTKLPAQPHASKSTG
jgi:hypothetical protein